MNHIGDTRPAPLSINELTTEYWNSYTNWNSFINIKYRVVQNIEILGIKLKL